MLALSHRKGLSYEVFGSVLSDLVLRTAWCGSDGRDPLGLRCGGPRGQEGVRLTNEIKSDVC